MLPMWVFNVEMTGRMLPPILDPILVGTLLRTLR